MESQDDDSPKRSGPEAALRALEGRLERASDAAERLIAEAAGAARRTPAAGWAVPEPGRNGGGSAGDESPSGKDGGGDGGGKSGDRTGDGASASSGDPAAARSDDDLTTILAFVRGLRDLVPPDLQRRLAEALRELLLAVRALIDWYLERIEQRRRTPTPVEDIPIF